MDPAAQQGETPVVIADAVFSDVTAALTSADTLPFFVEEVKNSDWCVAKLCNAPRDLTLPAATQVRVGAAADAHCLMGQGSSAG